MKKEKLQSMLDELDKILAAAKSLQEYYQKELELVNPDRKISALNLIHYRAMRQLDIRELQEELGYMGLSRLAKAEGNIISSIQTSRSILKALLKRAPIKWKRNDLTPKKSQKILNTNARKLLGHRSKGRRTRIMVTMPSEAADNPEMVQALVDAGMNSARINCAHDDAESWAKMISHIREAQEKGRRKIKICMDLAGPKIRTGAISQGPEIIRIKSKKNEVGQITEPAKVWLAPEPHEYGEGTHLPIREQDLKLLKKGMTLQFRDTRGRKRRFKIHTVNLQGCWASSEKTAYVQSGTPLYIKVDQAPIIVGELQAMELALTLKEGETLILHQDNRLGENAQFDEEGKLTQAAHISCTSPDVFKYVKKGEKVLFDDGKIETVIEECSDTEMSLKVVRAKSGGAKLKADKGINFPDSELLIHGLTEKDKRDLPFVAANADVVNMSFVNRKEDVIELLEELEKLGAKDKLGIILKIETRKGFQNLTDILLAAMQTSSVGVMIARGDLAIESGWEEIGRIQEEILWLCQAGHIPDVWATQVLENLAKSGLPSRAEITDAAMAQRAECVMLNKGPYIVDAINLLNTILHNMQKYQVKKAPMLPEMQG